MPLCCGPPEATMLPGTVIRLNTVRDNVDLLNLQIYIVTIKWDEETVAQETGSPF